MYLRKCRKTAAGREYVYWQLVESCRTERGPRQRIVAYLSDLDESQRRGVADAARGHVDERQENLVADEITPTWVEVDPARLRVEWVQGFGAYWLGLQVLEKIGLIAFLDSVVEKGREDIPWSVMAMVLVLMRLVEPSSELRIAEHLFERSALSTLLGIAPTKVNDDRLYRALDQVRPHTEALEKYLKERLGALFHLDDDLLLDDITSTYFEGAGAENPDAQFGYSRDKRSDGDGWCDRACAGIVHVGRVKGQRERRNPPRPIRSRLRETPSGMLPGASSAGQTPPVARHLTPSVGQSAA